MASQAEARSEVRIIEPDRSLQIKVGVPNLDNVFTAKALAGAQAIIADSAASFLNDSLALLQELVQAHYDLLKNVSPTKNLSLTKIIDTSFMIKTKTGQGGYTLIASIAKSLQLHAEKAEKDGLSVKMIDVLSWHVASLQQMMKMKIEGNGGKVGEAIMQEILRLSAANTAAGQPSLKTT